MHKEIVAAAKFIIFLIKSTKRSQINKKQLRKLKIALIEQLYFKYNQHWNISNPLKGSGYRCIRSNGALDPIIISAVSNAGLSVNFIQKALPPQFTIWVDPFMVEYRIGENGSTCILYEEKQLKLNVIPLNNNLWTVIKRFS